MSDSVVEALVASIAEAKDAGNKALKEDDLSGAKEHYEKALERFDEGLDALPPEEIGYNDLVKYEGGFAVVDTAAKQFQDYILQDLYTYSIVKAKVGRFEEVATHFKDTDLKRIPRELFAARLAVVQNMALLSLKHARATGETTDFEDVIRAADRALAMDGKSPKALMRKGAALVELKEIDAAAQVLGAAAKETKGQDKEVQRLLQTVLMEQRRERAKAKAEGFERGSIPNCPFRAYEEYAQKTGAVSVNEASRWRRDEYSDDEQSSTDESVREMLAGRMPAGAVKCDGNGDPIETGDQEGEEEEEGEGDDVVIEELDKSGEEVAKEVAPSREPKAAAAPLESASAAAPARAPPALRAACASEAKEVAPSRAPKAAAASPASASAAAPARAPPALWPAFASEAKEAGGDGTDGGDVDFAAAAAYGGSREGMVFKTGSRGLGYYRDRRPVAREQGATSKTPELNSSVASGSNAARSQEARAATATAAHGAAVCDGDDTAPPVEVGARAARKRSSPRYPSYAAEYDWQRKVKEVVFICMVVLIVGGSAILWLRGPVKSSRSSFQSTVLQDELEL